jgi:hypothetical protein
LLHDEWVFDESPCVLCPHTAHCRQGEACDAFESFIRSGGRRCRSAARVLTLAGAAHTLAAHFGDVRGFRSVGERGIETWVCVLGAMPSVIGEIWPWAHDSVRPHKFKGLS